jgi:site-specific DNA-methyltransferase (adenine-specific)
MTPAITTDESRASSGCVHRLVREFLDLRRMDCMKLMAGYPDGHFDLAIVDPPYGIGDKFKGGRNGKMQFNEVVEKGWDVAPAKEYFDELRRVSRYQIIWGGNYFQLPPSRCWIIWDKQISEDFSLAMAELAWASRDGLAKIFRMPTPKDGKIHPTQKPVKLYAWLLANYAKPGQRILDTHMGSGSIAIACHYARLHLTACEIDEDYFKAACARIERETAQQSFIFPNAESEALT